MSGIRYTPPAGGAGVTPDLQQVLDAGNSATGQTIILIDGTTGTDDCVWTPRGMTAASEGAEKLVILAASTSTAPDEEGVIRMYGASNTEEQITIESTTTEGGAITVAIDEYTKLRLFNDRIEYHKIEGFLPAVATLLFPGTITDGDIYQIQPTPGTFAWLSDLPQDTGWVNLSLQPGFTAFNSSSYRHRVYGKVCTISLTGTVNGTISIVANVNITGAVPTSLGIDYTGADTNKISISSSGQIIITTSTGGNVTAGTLVNAFFTYIIAG